jgi:hypothetical protein
MGISPGTGPVVSKGLWTSLPYDANSFDHANKDKRWEKFFSNTESAIAQEHEREICRVTRLWLGVLQPFGIIRKSISEWKREISVLKE